MSKVATQLHPSYSKIQPLFRASTPSNPQKIQTPFFAIKRANTRVSSENTTKNVDSHLQNVLLEAWNLEGA